MFLSGALTCAVCHRPHPSRTRGRGSLTSAFAAQAYTSALVFSILTLNEHWPAWLAFLVSVVVLAPAIGLAFHHSSFWHIPNTNGMAKLVTSIGLLVGIPSLLTVIFTNQPFYGVPSILFNPNNVYFHLFGLHEVPLNGIFLSTVLVTAVVLLAMVVLMRFTNLGLKMRATVENRRLVGVDGINANRVVVWAGLSPACWPASPGVLLAPQFAQLEPENYITLMVAVFAAAAWGVLQSMPIAALVAIGFGVVQFTAQGYLPTGGILDELGAAGAPSDRAGGGPALRARHAEPRRHQRSAGFGERRRPRRYGGGLADADGPTRSSESRGT